MRTAVTVLARAPEAGRVKTRLARDVGDEAAARLHAALAGDVLDGVSRWSRARDGGSASLVLALTGDVHAGRALEGSALHAGWRVERQPEGDLGARIAAALDARLREGSEAALVLGADAPLLPDDLLDEAVRELRGADVVLSPAADGGFVLIGARRFGPGALDGVRWGTPSALADARAALASAGLDARLVGGGEDVDELADLHRIGDELAGRESLAPRTADWLRGWREARR